MQKFKNGRFSRGRALVRQKVKTASFLRHRITDSTQQAASTTGRTSTEAPPQGTVPSSSAQGPNENRRNYLRLPAQTEPPTCALIRLLCLPKNLKRLPGLGQTASPRSHYSPLTPSTLDPTRPPPKKNNPEQMAPGHPSVTLPRP